MRTLRSNRNKYSIAVVGRVVQLNRSLTAGDENPDVVSRLKRLYISE